MYIRYLVTFLYITTFYQKFKRRDASCARDCVTILRMILTDFRECTVNLAQLR